MADNIFLKINPESRSFTSLGSGGENPKPPRKRMKHAEKLKLDLLTEIQTRIDTTIQTEIDY